MLWRKGMHLPVEPCRHQNCSAGFSVVVGDTITDHCGPVQGGSSTSKSSSCRTSDPNARSTAACCRGPAMGPAHDGRGTRIRFACCPGNSSTKQSACCTGRSHERLWNRPRVRPLLFHSHSGLQGHNGVRKVAKGAGSGQWPVLLDRCASLSSEE